MFPLWFMPKKMMCRRDDTQGPDPSAVADACNEFRSEGQKHNISRWATSVHISKSPSAEPLRVSDSWWQHLCWENRCAAFKWVWYPFRAPWDFTYIKDYLCVCVCVCVCVSPGSDRVVNRRCVDMSDGVALLSSCFLLFDCQQECLAISHTHTHTHTHTHKDIHFWRFAFPPPLTLCLSLFQL